MARLTEQVRMDMQARGGRLPLSEWVYALLVWGPILARFLLPSSLEERMLVEVAGLPFLLTDGVWLLLPLCEWMTGICSVGRRPRIAFYYLVLAGLASCQVLANGENLPVRMGTLAYVFLPLVVLSLYNFSQRGGRIHGWLLLGVTLYLCLQVVGFTLHVFNWSVETSTEEYGGVVRTRSTVGASTATGVVVLMVGCLTCSFHRWRRSGLYGFCALVAVGVISTLSRGAILALPLAMFPLWRQLLVRRSATHLRDGIRLVCVVLAVGGVLHWSHLGTAIRERVEIIAYQGDIATGRMDRMAEAWTLFRAAPVFGNGMGTTLVPAVFGWDSSWMEAGAGVVSPHNAYVALLADIGIVGSVLFWVPLLRMLVRTAGQGRTSLTWCAMASVFLVCMNTETILLTFEFMGVVYLSLLSLVAFPHPGGGRGLARSGPEGVGA